MKDLPLCWTLVKHAELDQSGGPGAAYSTLESSVRVKIQLGYSNTLMTLAYHSLRIRLDHDHRKEHFRNLAEIYAPYSLTTSPYARSASDASSSWSGGNSMHFVLDANISGDGGGVSGYFIVLENKRERWRGRECSGGGGMRGERSRYWKRREI